MAVAGRMRGHKRSSSSSYSSTVTTLAVLAFCVLAIWMLTSDYMVPSQGTTRKASDAQPDVAATTDKIEESPSTNKSNSFEDDPGDLPDDALGSDDPLKVEVQKGAKDGGKQEKAGKFEGGGVDENDHEIQVSEETSFTQNQYAKINQESSSKNAVANGKTENFDQQDQSTKTEEARETRTNAFDTHKQRQEERIQPGNSVTFSDETKKDQSGKQESYDMTKKNDMEEAQERRSSNKAQDTKQGTTVLQNSGIPKESKESKKSWSTQATESNKEKERQPVKQESKGMTKKADMGEVQEGRSTHTAQDTKQATTVLQNPGIPKASKEPKKSLSTQDTESNKEKDRHKVEAKKEDNAYGFTWQLCNVTTGPDYIPCLDNANAVKKLKSTKHFEHRERHCPEDPPTCLVSLPEQYKKPIPWPESRTKIWFHNVPHPGLAKLKGHQNWVKVTGEFLTFPGGGTQFIHGALNYIDFIEKAAPSIAWGRQARVVLDVGCGVASFGGFLFEKDVLTMSFAPKDEHEAQVQFALERGIPAISAVMGSKRLPFPSRAFDLIHCARCRVPWHVEGGRLLLELNRMLRPGGYFVWSATPVYQSLPEDVEIWEAMSNLTKSMCWNLETIQRDKVDKVAAAIYRKPTGNDCYKERTQDDPPMCTSDDDPNAAWYMPLQTCMHWVPTSEYERGSKWPATWPTRLSTPPYWLNKTQKGIYGKPAPEDFIAEYEHWKHLVNNTYLTSLGISWSNVRNVIDMRAVYGGFAAALTDLQLWVLNVVNINAPDTLPVIFERGLFGIYHDWCESFITYPRTYDLLHADHLFSQLKTRCNLAPVMAEVDRIVRPGGYLVVRDEPNAIGEVESLLKSLHWEVHLAFSKDQEVILRATKSYWRP